MRAHRIIVGMVAAALSSAAFAQDVTLKLNTQDQSDLKAICALAIRSPAVTQPEDILLLADVCVRWRNEIRDALKAAEKPQTPKD